MIPNVVGGKEISAIDVTYNVGVFMKYLKNMNKILLLSFLFAFSGLVTPSRAEAGFEIIHPFIEKLDLAGVALVPVMGYLYWKASRVSSGQSQVPVTTAQPAETGCVLKPFIPYIVISSVGIIVCRQLLGKK